MQGGARLFMGGGSPSKTRGDARPHAIPPRFTGALHGGYPMRGAPPKGHGDAMGAPLQQGGGGGMPLPAINWGPPCPPVPGPPVPPSRAPLCPPVPRGPRTPAGRTSKVKNVFRFKIDAKSVPEALATTILILQKFSIDLAHRQNLGASAHPDPSETPHPHPIGPPSAPHRPPIHP